MQLLSNNFLVSSLMRCDPLPLPHPCTPVRLLSEVQQSRSSPTVEPINPPICPTNQLIQGRPDAGLHRPRESRVTTTPTRPAPGCSMSTRPSWPCTRCIPPSPVFIHPSPTHIHTHTQPGDRGAQTELQVCSVGCPLSRVCVLAPTLTKNSTSNPRLTTRLHLWCGRRQYTNLLRVRAFVHELTERCKEAMQVRTRHKTHPLPCPSMRPSQRASITTPPPSWPIQASASASSNPELARAEAESRCGKIDTCRGPV